MNGAGQRSAAAARSHARRGEHGEDSEGRTLPGAGPAASQGLAGNAPWDERPLRPAAGFGLGHQTTMWASAAAVASIARIKRSAPAVGSRVPFLPLATTVAAKAVATTSTSPSAGVMPSALRPPARRRTAAAAASDGYAAAVVASVGVARAPGARMREGGAPGAAAGGVHGRRPAARAAAAAHPAVVHLVAAARLGQDR